MSLLHTYFYNGRNACSAENCVGLLKFQMTEDNDHIKYTFKKVICNIFVCDSLACKPIFPMLLWKNIIV